MVPVKNTNPEYTDNRDAALAKNGDKAAFERLLEENNDSMYRIASIILKHREDIEDAYQNTIMKCFGGLRNLRSEEFFRTWLIRILINECRSILKARRRTVPLEVDHQGPSPCDFSSRLELTSAVNSLEEDLRIVTLLFYFEDMPQKKISRILGIPEGTVASRLSRARRRLYQILKDS